MFLAATKEVCLGPEQQQRHLQHIHINSRLQIFFSDYKQAENVSVKASVRVPKAAVPLMATIYKKELSDLFDSVVLVIIYDNILTFKRSVASWYHKQKTVIQVQDLRKTREVCIHPEKYRLTPSYTTLKVEKVTLQNFGVTERLGIKKKIQNKGLAAPIEIFWSHGTQTSTRGAS